MSRRSGRGQGRGWLTAALAVALGVVLAGEYAHYRASHTALGNWPAEPGNPRTALGNPRTEPGNPPAEPKTEAVIVLGFRNRRPDRANALNRWRVRAGLRSPRGPAHACTFVFTGAPASEGMPSEAALMARYAIEERGCPPRSVVLEERARTTWENIRHAAPLVEHADSIMVVSNSLHALKGRVYLRRQRPDLARRLARGGDYRFGELWYLKPLLALKGIRDARRRRKP